MFYVYIYIYIERERVIYIHTCASSGAPPRPSDNAKVSPAVPDSALLGTIITITIIMMIIIITIIPIITIIVITIIPIITQRGVTPNHWTRHVVSRLGFLLFRGPGLSAQQQAAKKKCLLGRIAYAY